MEMENIVMDFIVGLPKTLKGYTVIWVVVDRLTKSAHFLPGKATYTINNWAQLYVKEIVRLHGVTTLIFYLSNLRSLLYFEMRNIHSMGPVH